MKHLLTLSMIICNACYGQIVINDNFKAVGSWERPLPLDSMLTINEPINQRKRDTVKVICQYSDSTINYVTHNHIEFTFGDTIHPFITIIDTIQRLRDYDIHYGNFYSVREPHTAKEILDSYNWGSHTYGDFYKHICYLDKNKLPLSKNIIIWQSKELQ